MARVRRVLALGGHCGLRAWLVLASLLIGAGVSRAQGARGNLALNWVRLGGAESCPDSVEVARRVEAHLGRSVFWSAADADESIEATVARSADSWVLELHVQDRQRRRGRRVLHSSAAQCDELTESAVLVIAALADPRHDMGASRVAPGVDGVLDDAFGDEPTDPAPDSLVPVAPTGGVADAAATSRAVLTSAPPTSAPRTVRERKLRLTLDAGAALGRAPGPGAALAVGLLVRAGVPWPLHVQGTMLAPSTASRDGTGGSARVLRWDGSLRLCPLHAGPWLACAGAGVGAIWGDARGFVHTRPPFGPLMTLDLEAQLRHTLALSQRWGLSFAATASLALRRPELRFRTPEDPQSPVQLFEMPALGVQLVVGLELGL